MIIISIICCIYSIDLAHSIHLYFTSKCCCLKPAGDKEICPNPTNDPQCLSSLCCDYRQCMKQKSLLQEPNNTQKNTQTTREDNEGVWREMSHWLVCFWWQVDSLQPQQTESNTISVTHQSEKSLRGSRVGMEQSDLLSVQMESKLISVHQHNSDSNCRTDQIKSFQAW